MYAHIIDGEVTQYPCTIADIRAANPNTIILLDYSAEDLAALNYYEPQPTEPPAVTAEQALEEAAPVLIDGVLTQQWAIRDRTPEELDEAKAAKRAAITDRYIEHVRAGWTHDFGAAGIHTLDLRPEKDDKANWTLLLLKTDGMIKAGGGALPVKIRTAANVSIEVTAAEANAAMIAFLAWGEAGLDYKWELDDLAVATQSFADLEAIDIEAGWPS